MNKLIIENRSRLSMESALHFVGIILSDGKISESSGKPQYSHHTIWDPFPSERMGLKKGDRVHASSFRNAKSDRIVIHHNDGKDWQK